MTDRGPRYIAELDGLRGVACLAVVVAHCFGDPLEIKDVVLWPQAIWLTLQDFLMGGVDLFFVLSGFLIGGILIDHRGASNFFATFWMRRAGRILPVLLLVVGTYALLLLVRPYIGASFLDAWLLEPPVNSPLWYLSFTQTIPMMSAWGPAWLAPSWSLAIEEQFYLFFPFLVYLLPPRRLAIVMALLAVSAPVCRGLVHHFAGWQAAFVLLPCRMDGLALGVLLAIGVRTPGLLEGLKERRRSLDLVLCALGILIVGNQFYAGSTALRGSHPLAADMIHTLVYSALALFFALCILRIFLRPGGLYSRVLTWKPLMAIGLISYGLYMYHQPINGLVHGLLFGQKPQIGSWQELTAGLVVIALAIVVSVLSYRLIETPIRRMAQRVTFKHTEGQTPHRPSKSLA